MRRILGAVILIVALVLVLILAAGAVFASQAIDAVGVGLANGVDLAVETMDALAATLNQTKSTISEANNALDTATQLTSNLSITVSDTKPLMESITTVIASDIPGNIEAVQAAVPNIAQVAGVIDTTLTKLSSFRISQTIPIPFNPITFEFDLGIDYAPDEPFDTTVLALGTSLEGMPDDLRSLQGQLETLNSDLETLSADLESAAGDIAGINAQVALFLPILDEYLRIVDQISTSLVQVNGQVASQLGTVKLGVTLLFIFLALTQLTPLYVGWELLTGKRMTKGKEQEKDSPAPKEPKVEKEVEEPPLVEAPVAEAETEPEKEPEMEAENMEASMPDSETVIEAAPPAEEETDQQS